MQDTETLRDWIKQAQRIVFFGGAGVSTESNIPDFRSEDGLYHLSYQYPPETILSHTFFMRQTEEFFRFYRDKMLYLDARPNAAHKALAKWEREGKLQGVITQNIDGLHQKAGSKTVIELHGSVLRNYCMRCGKFYSAEDLEMAVQMIQSADVLIVGGTSLAVYPAAGLIDYYRGHRLVLINKAPTPYDRKADLLIAGKIGEVLKGVAEEV